MSQVKTAFNTVPDITVPKVPAVVNPNNGQGSGGPFYKDGVGRVNGFNDSQVPTQDFPTGDRALYAAYSPNVKTFSWGPNGFPTATTIERPGFGFTAQGHPTYAPTGLSDVYLGVWFDRFAGRQSDPDVVITLYKPQWYYDSTALQALSKYVPNVVTVTGVKFTRLYVAGINSADNLWTLHVHGSPSINMDVGL